jgi:hypothetical protein
MEHLILEKLNETAKILLLLHQKIESLQKLMYVYLKRTGQLPGLENIEPFNCQDKTNSEF